MQEALGSAELRGMALSLALGLLIGVQRGWVLRNETPGSRFAGIRTYALLGLVGGIAGALQGHAGALGTVLLAASAALVVLGYWRSTRIGSSISGTASLSGLITLACGFLAGIGQFALASAGTGVTVAVLSLRTQLHGWIRTLDERDVWAMARFGLIALVVLPLLPDTPFGPFDAWRPRQLWLVVVLVCGFSLAGYAAAKRLGASRGILATAAAGATVSSTAVTASLSAKLRDGEGDPAILNAGIALASAMMHARVMALTAFLAQFALPTFALLAGPGLLVSLGATAWLVRRGKTGSGPDGAALALRNPFDIGPALLLMALVMVVSVAARWVMARYGDAGLATVLALSGMLDVDSAIIAMGNLPAGTLDARTAGLVLIPPILLNSVVKSFAAAGLAGRAALPGIAAMLGSVAASLVAVAMVLLA